MEQIRMEVGKIYFISYGGNTQIVGRFKSDDACNYFFFDLLHYWNGNETFHKRRNEYAVKSGISEIRPASKAEKMALFKYELEHDCV